MNKGRFRLLTVKNPLAHNQYSPVMVLPKEAEALPEAEAVVVVSHNMSFVKNVCTRAIWLDEGRLEFDGAPEEAVARYQARVRERKQARKRRSA